MLGFKNGQVVERVVATGLGAVQLQGPSYRTQAPFLAPFLAPGRMPFLSPITLVDAWPGLPGLGNHRENGPTG